MKVLQQSPNIAVSQGLSPGILPGQGGAPQLPTQYPAPYTPVQTGTTGMLGEIMPLIILMMVMGMMMPMMKGITATD